MDGNTNRLFYVIMFYIFATQILPQTYQFVIVLMNLGNVSGVMG